MSRRARPRSRKVQLHEDVVRGSRKLRVDREKGVVYGVKVAGLESKNRRRYLPEAYRAALPLYEGLGVNGNHPARPEAPRDVNDRFGWLENVRPDAAGELYGDLHVLVPASELAQKVFKAAEEKPDLFGLSHNAQGEGEDGPDGVFVVHKILEVRSVDLVLDPATVNGLNEQVERRPMKLKAFFEAVKWPARHEARIRGRIAKLLEGPMDGDADMPADVTEAPADHEQALKDGFRASVAACVDECLAGEEDPAECVKRIKELLTAHAKLAGGGDVEEEEEDKPEKPEGGEGAAKKEEAEEQLRRLAAKDRARDLCEEAGVSLAGKEGKELLEDLLACKDEPAMRRLVAREQRYQKAGGPRNAPRSGAGGGAADPRDLTEQRRAALSTPEGILAALGG